MQKKYQIFVSSTFRDLAEERQDAIRSILDLGHIPAGMELFPATDVEQLSYIKKVIDECDYYVLILGGRYGSLDAEGVSFTEREYDYAVDTGKIVLAFVHGDSGAIPVGKSDTAPKLVQSLNEFRDKVMTGRLVREWTTRESLEAILVKSIARATNDFPAIGWIRGNAAANEDILLQINTLRQDNDALRAKIAEIKRETQQKIEGLAELSDQVTIRYKFTVNNRDYGSYDKEAERKTTWGKVFSAVGPSLQSPTSKDSVKIALYKLLKEELGAEGVPAIREADLIMVENHLVALNLVNSYNATAVKGGVFNYLKLTDMGRSTLLGLTAARKNVG